MAPPQRGGLTDRLLNWVFGAPRLLAFQAEIEELRALNGGLADDVMRLREDKLHLMQSLEELTRVERERARALLETKKPLKCPECSFDQFILARRTADNQPEDVLAFVVDPHGIAPRAYTVGTVVVCVRCKRRIIATNDGLAKMPEGLASEADFDGKSRMARRVARALERARGEEALDEIEGEPQS